jgi:hypothetical protein
MFKPPSLSLPHKGGGNAVALAFAKYKFCADESSTHSTSSPERIRGADDAALLRFPPPLVGEGQGGGPTFEA